MREQLFKKSIAVITALALFLSVFPLISADVYAAGDSVVNVDLKVTNGQTEGRKMLGMINAFRTDDGAWEYTEENSKYYHSECELTYDYELERIATQRAAEIALLFSHTRPDGSSFDTAYTSGFNFAAKGENIAMGYETAEDAFEAFKEEYESYDGQGHRRNMLCSFFGSVGIGHVVYNGVDYWAQEFSDITVDTTRAEPRDSEETITVSSLEEYIPGSGGESETHNSGYFEYTLTDDGDAIITGCSASGDVVIPEYIDGHKVVLLAKQLFYGEYGITSVSIPATIEYLDMWDYVFSYCFDLEAIYVDENNPVLKSVDGVLYSKDMSILYNYPNAKTGKTYTVPEETTALCCTSFAYAKLDTLTLENPDTRWYTYTFYGDGGLVVIYKEGGLSQSLTENGTDYGPTFTADADYVPPADDPVNPDVPDDPENTGDTGNSEDAQAADDFMMEAFYYAGDPESLTLDDEIYISWLRQEYENLSPEAKALVEPEYYELLVNAEKKIDELYEEANAVSDDPQDPADPSEDDPIDPPTVDPVDSPTVDPYDDTPTYDPYDDSSAYDPYDEPEPVVKAPGRAVIKKLKPLRKSAKITIKKKSGNVRYKVQYRIKGKKKWKTKYLKKTTYTFKKLKSGKRYQFRVRAYKKVNGVKYYGKWSKIKTVKIR